MPFERLKCPQCRTTMKPARPVDEGKKVKCPSCGNVFVAGSDLPGKGAASGGKISASPTKGGAAAAAGSAQSDEDAPGAVYGFAAGEEPVLKPPEPPLQKKKRLRDDDEDDEDEDDDEDDDDEDEEEVDPVLEMYLKQNRSNNPRGPAMAMLARPSNYLIITHGLLAVLQFLAFTYWIFPLVFSDHLVTPKELLRDPDFPEAQNKEYKGVLEDRSWEEIETAVKGSDSKKKQQVTEKLQGQFKIVLDRLEVVDSERRQERWIQLIFPFLLMIYLACIVYGAVQMQAMESYNWAWAAVIMALIPVASAGAAWTGCYWWRRLLDLDSDSWIFWVPFVLITLWSILAAVLALVTMLKPNIKEAFFYVFE